MKKTYSITIEKNLLNELIESVQKTITDTKTSSNTSENITVIARNLSGSLDQLSYDNYIIFKAIIESFYAEYIKRNKSSIDFGLLILKLDDTFYNWERFFSAQSVYNFLEKNISFIILFILLLYIFIYKHKHNINLTTSYLEVFITVLIFSLILFIYHRCSSYEKGCKIAGISASSIFAFILCLGLIIHLVKLHKHVEDKKHKKK